MRTLPKTDEEIEAECKRLNISFDCSSNSTGLDRAEMQKRILAVWSNNRNSSLWIIALISAIASTFSALAAIIAVACTH